MPKKQTFMVPGEEVMSMVVVEGAHYLEKTRTLAKCRYTMEHTCGHRTTMSHKSLQERIRRGIDHGMCQECSFGKGALQANLNSKVEAEINRRRKRAAKKGPIGGLPPYLWEPPPSSLTQEGQRWMPQ